MAEPVTSRSPPREKTSESSRYGAGDSRLFARRHRPAIWLRRNDPPVPPRWLERHANSWRAKPRLPQIPLPQDGPAAHLETAGSSCRCASTRVIPSSRPGRLVGVAALPRGVHLPGTNGRQPTRLPAHRAAPAGQQVPYAGFPGCPCRIEAMNDALAATVAKVDKPNVRFFRVSPLVDEFCGGDLDVATPNGSHFSPEMHRHIGTALAKEIARRDRDAATSRATVRGQPAGSSRVRPYARRRRSSHRHDRRTTYAGWPSAPRA